MICPTCRSPYRYATTAGGAKFWRCAVCGRLDAVLPDGTTRIGHEDDERDRDDDAAYNAQLARDHRY